MVNLQSYFYSSQFMHLILSFSYQIRFDLVVSFFLPLLVLQELQYQLWLKFFRVLVLEHSNICNNKCFHRFHCFYFDVSYHHLAFSLLYPLLLHYLGSQLPSFGIGVCVHHMGDHCDQRIKFGVLHHLCLLNSRLFHHGRLCHLFNHLRDVCVNRFCVLWLLRYWERRLSFCIMVAFDSYLIFNKQMIRY